MTIDQTNFPMHHEASDETVDAMSESRFEQDVRGFVLRKLGDDDDKTVTCQSLTIEFLERFIEQYGPLGGWRVAAYTGVAQTIRPILRKADDPHEGPTQTEMDLPETALLQKKYSVLGAGEDGEAAYVPRHKLTKEQMELVVTRFRTVSVHCQRKADALESWWHRNFDGRNS